MADQRYGFVQLVDAGRFRSNPDGMTASAYARLLADCRAKKWPEPSNDTPRVAAFRPGVDADKDPDDDTPPMFVPCDYLDPRATQIELRWSWVADPDVWEAERRWVSGQAERIARETRG